MPLARLKFKNNTQSTITYTLGVFYYDDGTRSTDPPSGEPGEVSISYGEAGYRFSTPESKCVQRMYGFLVWTTGSNGLNLPPAQPGYCVLERGIELNPKSLIKKDLAGTESYEVLVAVNPETGQLIEAVSDVPDELLYLFEKYGTSTK